MSLENRAMIAVLSMGQWSARKMDKRETAAVAAKHGTAIEVGSYWKSVLPFTKSLDDIHKKSGAIRTFHYANTAEWGIEGQRIFKSSHFLTYGAGMRTHLAERARLVRAFLPQYPHLQQLARNTLNGMYNDDDYPSPDEVERKFHAKVSYMPVATAGDWRVELADSEMDELRMQLTADIQESCGVAMKDVWQRLYKVVKHAADTLADPKAKGWKDTLILNPLELCKLLPNLNLTDDPNLEAMRNEVEGVFAAHSIEAIRQPGVTRNETVAKLADVMSKMGAFYAPT